MMKHFRKSVLTSAAVLSMMATAASAETFTISTGLPQNHNWTFGHMDLFIESMQEATGGEVTFTPFYAGELTAVGRELDSVSGGVVDSVILLSPFQEGAFRLSDVTQLPAYDTDSFMVTRAFQRLLDSDEEVTDGKTFYDYEITDKGIQVWALGATAAYSVATTGKELVEPSDFQGLPLRTGTAIHTMVLEHLGATPVIIPGVQSFEAMSRGTIAGTIQSVSDWGAYSLEQLLRYTVMEVSLGHWESYLAIRNDAWDRLSDEQKELWDEIARKTALENSQIWEDVQQEMIETSKSEFDGKFVPVSDLSEEMQKHFATAAANTWFSWVDQLEAEGVPAKATARLYAQFLLDEGATLPEGVEEFLEL